MHTHHCVVHIPIDRTRPPSRACGSHTLQYSVSHSRAVYNVNARYCSCWCSRITSGCWCLSVHEHTYICAMPSELIHTSCTKVSFCWLVLVLHQFYYCCIRCVKSADRRARWKPTDRQFMTFFFRAFQFKKQRKVKEDFNHILCVPAPDPRFLNNNLARSFFVCSCIGLVKIQTAVRCVLLRLQVKVKTHVKRSPLPRTTMHAFQCRVIRYGGALYPTLLE
jgi:hypothetical protein